MAPLATKRCTKSCRRCGNERRKWHICAAGGQQHRPPAAAAAAVGPDRISDLPDELLCAIVSFLPTKDGARTMVLSRRWSGLWPSAALNLDDGDIDCRRYGEELFERLVTRILQSTHRGGTIRRLRFTHLYDTLYHRKILDGWLRSPALNKLEELHLRYKYKFMVDDGRVLPLPALRFSDLRVASYGRCRFPEDLGGVKFPRLRELTLYELNISETTLHAMIAACCPGLRSLLLRDNVGFRRFCVSSPSLVSLGSISVKARHPVMEELVIVDAPSMVKLLIFDTYGSLKNMHVTFAPKLEVMGCLSSDMLNVQLESTVFQKSVAISPIKCLQAVKIFSLRVQGFKLDDLMDFLKCFPCLEKLYFLRNRSYWGDESGQMLNGCCPSFECLHRHLKEIVLDNTPFKDQYPSLYNIVRKKSATVAMVLRSNPLNVAFRRSLVGNNLQAWHHLVAKIVNVQLTDRRDIFVWCLKQNGQFTVRSMYRTMIA